MKIIIYKILVMIYESSMILYLSKLIRQINNINTPKTCYALQHIPDSLNEVCDCKIFCKFGPKGNAPIDNFNLNYNSNNDFNIPSEIFIKNKYYQKKKFIY